MKPIKNFLYIALTSLPFISFAASPLEEARVIAAVKEAFTSKKPQPLLDLYYWVGVTESSKAAIATYMTSEVQRALTVAEIQFIEPDPKAIPDFTQDGVTYRANLPITKNLEVKLTDVGKTQNITLRFQVSEKDGKLYFVTIAPIK